jgi:1-aminocyclopropane-1-carboxylate deaminase/D-cysteine desulfhydrase-like pyridoxal-dependent ACC family enzyme
MVAELGAMITDSVYEGNLWRGLIDLCQKNEFKQGSNVLYIYLGGARGERLL